MGDKEIKLQLKRIENNGCTCRYCFGYRSALEWVIEHLKESED